MSDEKKYFVMALLDDTIVGILVLSAAFFIISGGLSLMKWVGIF